MKVVGVFSVLQTWRADYLGRLSDSSDLDLTVVHGGNIPSTKRVNTTVSVPFRRIELRVWHTSIRLSGRDAPLVLFRGLWGALKKERPNVLLLEGASNLINSVSALMWARTHNVPVVWWTLGEIPGRRYSTIGRAYRSMVAWLERHCDAVLVYSEQGRAYAQKIGVDPARCVVATNVVDTESVASIAGPLIERRSELKSEILGKDIPLVLYIGTLASGKDLDRLPALFHRIAIQVKDVGLMIVGDGPLRPGLEQAFVDLDLRDRVWFTGERQTDLTRYAVCGDVFLMPGLGGLAISHAMAHGVPVVCGQGDGVERDLVLSGRTGYLASSSDDQPAREAEMVEACVRILTDQALREALSTQAMELVTTTHTGSAMLERIREALQIAANGQDKKA